jgi:mycothiol synthase
MPARSYSIKNYSSEDFEIFVTFCVETEVLGEKERRAVSSLIQEKFKKPNYSPSQDLFLALWKEQIVGFLDMIPELRIGRIILDGFILSPHRRQGLATQLFYNALERARRAGGKVLHVCVPEEDHVCISFLKKLSFPPVCRFDDLELALSKIDVKKSFFPGIRVRNLKPGEEDLLADIQNQCFTGSWGFCPNTVEEIKFYLEWTGSQMEDVIAAESRESKDIIGYCWTHRVRRGASARKRGRIHMFGVHPEYRGKGLGERLLSQGLKYLKTKGVEVAELTIDTQNRPAHTIYQSLGFKPIASKLWLEKKIVNI